MEECFPGNTLILIHSFIFSLFLSPAGMCAHTPHKILYLIQHRMLPVTQSLSSSSASSVLSTVSLYLSLFSFHLPFGLENSYKFLKTQLRPIRAS